MSQKNYFVTLFRPNADVVFHDGNNLISHHDLEMDLGFKRNMGVSSFGLNLNVTWTIGILEWLRKILTVVALAELVVEHNRSAI